MTKEKCIDAFLSGAYFCTGIILFTALGIFYVYFVSQWRNEDVVQTLCSKNQYDFCEVQKTIYKLKEFKK